MFVRTGWKGQHLFDRYIVSAAPFGGPVAVVPDQTSPSNTIRIFNGNGLVELGSASLTSLERNVVGHGWGSDELLYIVYENGDLLQLSPCAKMLSTFNVFETENLRARVLKFAWWPSRDGFVILTDEMRLWTLDIRSASKATRIADASIPDVRVKPTSFDLLSGLSTSRPPTAIGVIESKSRSGDVTLTVLFALWSVAAVDASSSCVSSIGVVSGVVPATERAKRTKKDPTHSGRRGVFVNVLPFTSSSTAASSPISHLHVHPSSQLVAVVTVAGSVTILTSDLSERLVEFVISDAPGASATPNFAYTRRGSLAGTRGHLGDAAAYVCWAGVILRCRATLAVMWRREEAGTGTLLLLDADGTYKWERVPIDSVLVSEVDGIRVVASNAVELFQIRDVSELAAALVDVSLDSRSGRSGLLEEKTPRSTDDLLMSPSSSPSSSSSLTTASISRDPLLERIESSSSSSMHLSSSSSSERVGVVERGVIDCLRISMSLFSRPQQEIYVDAAVFGKRWLDRQTQQDNDNGVEGRRRFLESIGVCCRQLRLLNALRADDVGVALTLPQFQYLGERILIARLARRRSYELAIRLSKHTRRPLDKESILILWASELMACASSRSSSSSLGIKRVSSSSSTGSSGSAASSASTIAASSPVATASDETLFARMRGNFERHGFTSYGSAAVIAGRRGLKGLCRLLLRHESSQRMRVTSYLLLDTRSFRLAALKEAAAMPFGFLDTELLVATLVRLQRVVFPVKPVTEDMFSAENKDIEQRQEREMHALVLAKGLPRIVADTYANVLRIMNLGNRRHRLLLRTGRVAEAARMFVEKGCVFYVPLKEAENEYVDGDEEKSFSSELDDDDDSGDDEEGDNPFARAIRRRREIDRRMLCTRPSRRGRMRTPRSARLGTEQRFNFLAQGHKLCADRKRISGANRTDVLTQYETALHQQMELLRIQVKFAPDVIGGSVVDTLLRLMARRGKGAEGASKLAEEMQRKFNINATRFDRIRVRAYARASKWNELDAWIERVGESSVNMVAVVDACLEARATCEAAQYAHRIQDKHERFEVFVQLEKWDQASLLAVQLGPTARRTLLLQPHFPEDLRAQLDLDVKSDVHLSRRHRSAIFSAPFRTPANDLSGASGGSSAGFFEKVRRSMPRLRGS